MEVFKEISDRHWHAQTFMAQFNFSHNIVLQIPRKIMENLKQGILSFCPEFEIVSLKYQIVTSVIFTSYIKHSYSVYSYQIAA